MLKLQYAHDKADDIDILILFIQNNDHNVLGGF